MSTSNKATVRVPSSRVKTNATPLFCYECQGWRPEKDMQKYDCSVCGGRKCLSLHTTDKEFACNDCGKTRLCVDCLSLGRCCE